MEEKKKIVFNNSQRRSAAQRYLEQLILYSEFIFSPSYELWREDPEADKEEEQKKKW